MRRTAAVEVLDGHGAAKARVFGAIDDTHAALAQGGEDPIGAEPVT
jgi:hypothetical protein